MFGLTFEKLLIIGVIAVFLLGPERLPHYAAQLGRLVRQLRDMANGAKDRMRDEMGPDFDDVDWKKLDPRQYDPRRIIREALLDEEPVATPTVSRSGAPVVATAGAAGGAAVGGVAGGAAVGGVAGAGASGTIGVNPNSAYLQKKRSAEMAAVPTPFDSEAT
ncbi:twin-arginine translocase TatA/TatE family subunit [Leifsonia stereocauli]|uniref:twin-arginine translocase TatA/TatE family subunit n=1 Tax=Leifsonia stereocauli TaxID=3134136 RepID=UPI003CC7A317